jgi:NAD(P) transhydrogenase
LASFGLSEAETAKEHGAAMVGRAPFAEIARGQISGCTEGLLRLVADGEGRIVHGVEVIGEGATELVAMGQVAITAGWEVDRFVDHVFNFPTMAEAYRAAALEIVTRREPAALPA